MFPKKLSFSIFSKSSFSGVFFFFVFYFFLFSSFANLFSIFGSSNSFDFCRDLLVENHSDCQFLLKLSCSSFSFLIDIQHLCIQLNFLDFLPLNFIQVFGIYWILLSLIFLFVFLIMHLQFNSSLDQKIYHKKKPNNKVSIFTLFFFILPELLKSSLSTLFF